MNRNQTRKSLRQAVDALCRTHFEASNSQRLEWERGASRMEFEHRLETVRAWLDELTSQLKEDAKEQDDGTDGM